MKRIKKIGSIIWGITYIMGSIFATITLLPLIVVIAIFNIIKQ